MSPLSVARAPHHVKEVELGHSHFFKLAHMEVGRVKYLGDTVHDGTKNVLKRKRALLLFSFPSSYYSATTVSQLST